MLITCGAAGGLADWPPAASLPARSAPAALPWPPWVATAAVAAVTVRPAGPEPAPRPEVARAPEPGALTSVTGLDPARAPEPSLPGGETVAVATGPACAVASSAVAGLLKVSAASATS